MKADSGEPIEGASLFCSLLHNETNVSGETRLSISDSLGDFGFVGTIPWSKQFGPISQRRSGSNMLRLKFKLSQTGYLPLFVDYPVSSLDRSEKNEYSVDLGQLKLRSDS